MQDEKKKISRHSLKENVMKKERKLLKWELSHLDKVFLAIVGSVGFILFWKGILDFIKTIPAFDSPFVSILSGLVILLLTGWIIKSGALRKD
jgi:hypothetical protein